MRPLLGGPLDAVGDDAGERAAAVGLVAAPLAYLVHSLVDYDWDFLAVTAPTLLAVGVLAGAGRPTLALARRPLVVVASVLLALSVLTSFAFPRLAERSNRSAIVALDEQNLAGAKSKALRARFFDPAPRPLPFLGRVDPINSVPPLGRREIAS